MEHNTTKTSKRRQVSQDIFPCDLNRLSYSLSWAESLTARPRKRMPKPLRTVQNLVLPKEQSQRPLFPPEADEHSGSSPRFRYPPEENEPAMNGTKCERCTEIMFEVNVGRSPEPEGAVVLDPEHSERQYYREPLTGCQREIWRPGDGYGSQGTDYYLRPGPALPMDQRWRLFQSNIGPMGLGQDRIEPPRFVFLDDRAVYEVLISNIQRARLTREWPHDFAASGKVRARRTHCGRPAIKDHLTNEYQSAPITKTARYLFTGEKDYRPVIYRVPPPEPAEPTVQELLRKGKAEDAADPALYNARAHGHNQHTPKDMMVKHGAPTFSRKKAKDEDVEMLSMLKSQTPTMGMEKRLYAEGAGRNSVSKAGSVRSRGGSGSSQASRTVASTACATSPIIKAGFCSSASPPQHGDEGDESDSDLDLFLRPDASTYRHISTPAISNSSKVEFPRQMDYIDRRAHEQALASKIVNAVQNQDHVVRLASELAEANVALIDQAKEIQRLKKALDETRSIMRQMRGVAEQGHVMDEA